MSNLEFGGLMGYEGSLSAFPDAATKVVACKKALGVLMETARTITNSGLEVRTVSSSGTMSYKTAAEFPGVTEVQAGGYLFMDIGYRNAGVDFETSLTLLTTVVSNPRPDKLIVDAGYKAISAESGLPGVKGRPDLEVTSLNAEHGHLAVKGGFAGPSTSVEDKLELLPTHADTTTCCGEERSRAGCRSPAAASSSDDPSVRPGLNLVKYLVDGRYVVVVAPHLAGL